MPIEEHEGEDTAAVEMAAKGIQPALRRDRIVIMKGESVGVAVMLGRAGPEKDRLHGRRAKLDRHKGRPMRGTKGAAGKGDPGLVRGQQPGVERGLDLAIAHR